MLYLDREVKDMKVAIPALISVTCLNPACPECQLACQIERLESRFAKQSKQHIRQNLVMFRRLLLGAEPGTDGLGFDDLLRHRGADGLADDVQTLVDAAIATVDTIEETTLLQALSDDPESVRAVHAAVKAVTDRLKSQFMSVLDLEPPNNGPTDND
jgi:hypothetical protein